MGIAGEEAFMQSRNEMSFQVSDVIQDAEAALQVVRRGSESQARPEPGVVMFSWDTLTRWRQEDQEFSKCQ